MNLDLRVARIAHRQHGVVAHRQLLDAGLSENAIAHRTTNGRLHRLHRGVYAVGHRALAPGAAEVAALLAVGGDAVLSHHTAAIRWELVTARPGPVHVTIAGAGGSRPRRRPGIRLHAVSQLSKEDRDRRGGLPVTAPARTLLDLAASLGERPLARAVEQAQVSGLVTATDLGSLIARSGGRRGVARLRAALDTVREPSLTRSEAEARLLDLIRGADLPVPRTNTRLHGYEVDCHWPEQRLVAEVDGYAFHSGRASFERDRRRDAALAAAGQRVVRFTWRRITGEPEAVTRELRILLDAR